MFHNANNNLFRFQARESLPNISSKSPSTINITFELSENLHLNEDAPNTLVINGSKSTLSNLDPITISDKSEKTQIEFNLYICQEDTCVPKKKSLVFNATEDGSDNVNYVYKIEI